MLGSKQTPTSSDLHYILWIASFTQLYVSLQLYPGHKRYNWQGGLWVGGTHHVIDPITNSRLPASTKA